MQLTCKVNQAEAIRRGFDANSTVKLEIDPAALSAEERATLADNFSSGEFKQGCRECPIPEPSVEGFLETLRLLVVAESETKAAEEKRRIESIALARKNFADRRVIPNTPELIANLVDGDIRLCDSYVGDNETRARATYTRLAPHNTYGANAEEFERLLGTPEGLAWCADLERINALVRADAEARIIAAVRQAIQRRAEKATRLEGFRQWAFAHGSETLRLRVEDGFPWEQLAEQEWAAERLVDAGLTETPLTDYEDYVPDSRDAAEPTAGQMKALRHFREVFDAATKVSLHDVTYTELIADEDNLGQDPEVIRRTEIRVGIPTPTGGEVVHYFRA